MRVSNVFVWAGPVALGAIVTVILTAPKPAKSQTGDFYPCPPGAKTCKVVTITPEEENTLVGPEMIFDHAEWANRVKFSAMLPSWRHKLLNAPPGKGAEEPQKP